MAIKPHQRAKLVVVVLRHNAKSSIAHEVRHLIGGTAAPTAGDSSEVVLSSYRCFSPNIETADRVSVGAATNHLCRPFRTNYHVDAIYLLLKMGIKKGTMGT